jgi:hypothetical protein
MSGAQFYSRDSEQPPSRDLYLIYVAIVYFTYHGANEDGKKRLHSIMRYLLPAELMLTLLCSDVTLLMLVVRIIVLICAFFNADFIPTLTLRLWIMMRSNAPVVWQWLRDKAPVVWQWLHEQWSEVHQHLAQQWVATERGGREALVTGARSRSPSPHERSRSQGVMPEITPEPVMPEITPEPVMPEIRQEQSAEQEGNSQQLVVGRATGPPVSRVVTPAIVSSVVAFQMPFASWLTPAAPRPEPWMTDLQNKNSSDPANMQMVVHPDPLLNKRKRDEGLPAEPESERAAKIQRT